MTAYCWLAEDAYLVDVEAEFSCRRCVNRIDDRILVTLTEQE